MRVPPYQKYERERHTCSMTFTITYYVLEALEVLSRYHQNLVINLRLHHAYPLHYHITQTNEIGWHS